MSSKEIHPSGNKTITTLEKNEIDDIHVVDNISDGFDEIPMKYFPKKQKGLHVVSLNELKSLSHNPNVPEECFDDFEIHLVKMVYHTISLPFSRSHGRFFISPGFTNFEWIFYPNSQFYKRTNTGSTFQCY